MLNAGRAGGISEAGRLWADPDEGEQGVRVGVGDETRLISDCRLQVSDLKNARLRVTTSTR